MDFSSFFGRPYQGQSTKTPTASSPHPASLPPPVAPAVNEYDDENRGRGAGGSRFGIPGLEFHRKEWFDEILPSPKEWRQNVLLLGQSNMGKSYFLRRLLNIVKPKRLVVISNTSAEQYRHEAGHGVLQAIQCHARVDRGNGHTGAYLRHHRRHSSDGS